MLSEKDKVGIFLFLSSFSGASTSKGLEMAVAVGETVGFIEIEEYEREKKKR